MSSMRRVLFALAALVVASSLARPAAATIAITGCGAVVPAGEVGVLQNDLDCSATPKVCIACDRRGCFPTSQACTDSSECLGEGLGCAFPAGVTVRRGATLDMNGHAIDGGPNCFAAVRCSDFGGKCSIVSSTGRGDITGHTGIFVVGTTRAELDSLDVHDCQGSGIASPILAANIVARNVTTTGNGGDGMNGGNLTLTNVTASDNAGRGLHAQKNLAGTGVTVDANGSFGAVSVRRFRLAGFVATGNGAAVPEGSGAGLWALRGGRMQDSTLTGNVYQDAGGPIPMDILSGRRLTLQSSTCGKSGGNGGLALGWGVCTGD